MENPSHPTGTIEIAVEMLEGELLFRLGDLYFDSLNADPFEQGTLEVHRQGTFFDRTRSIDWYGTHGACVCFIGLLKIGPGHSPYSASNALTPAMFQAGDVLRVEAPALAGTDFVAYLRDLYRSYRSMMDVFQEQREMTIGELQERMASKLSEHPDRGQHDRVLRFNT